MIMGGITATICSLTSDGIMWNIVIASFLSGYGKAFLLLTISGKVARLVTKGYTNAQIAEELFISVENVKRHMATIFENLGIESQKELMFFSFLN